MSKAELSKLLYEAREQVEMLADIVSARTGLSATYSYVLVERIDAYRAAQGWSADGFGGEDAE